jgi:RNA polymerase sigma factor (sigma-70 family)
VTGSIALAELSDVALIRRFLDGDERAFRTLYQRHTPRLRMMLARLLGAQRGELEDVLQETWLAGCRGIHRFRGEAQFSTWLTTIGVRTVRGRLRLNGGEIDEVSLDDQIAASPPASMATVMDLERAIERLPDHQRVVLVLHDVEGFTHEEIATQLGVAAGTSKGTLSRARAALRALLSDGVAYVF